MTKEKEVTKKAPTEVQLWDQNDTRGFENIDQEELIFPRLMLIQKMSPQLDEIAELIAGDFLNSLSNEIVSNATFVPIMKLPTFWVRKNPLERTDPDFNPDYDKGALIYKVSDPNDPRVLEDNRWVGDAKPKCTQYMNFMVCLTKTKELYILSFAKSSFTEGKRFLSCAKLKRAPLFAFKYSLNSVKHQKGANIWYVMSIKDAGRVETQEEFVEYGKIYDSLQFQVADIKVDVTDDHEPEQETKTEEQNPFGKTAVKADGEEALF